MNITRLGLVSLIVGLILLLNASSQHVGLNMIHSYGEIAPNQTDGYVLFMAPVGTGNFTCGYYRYPGMPAPLTEFDTSAYDAVVLPVHLKIEDPTNKTVFEHDIVTPLSLEMDFNVRGFYKVYITNQGNETKTVSVGLRFTQYEPINREADKYLLSIVLTAVGAVVTAVGFAVSFVLKHRKQNSYSSTNNTLTKHVMVSEVQPWL